MVTICSKKFCKPTIQDIMLAKIKKKEENKGIEEFFKKLKEQREQSNPRVLSGTSVPNSTFKSLHSAGKKTNDISILSIKDSTDIKNDKMKSSISINSKERLGSSLKSLKQNTQSKEASSGILIKPEERSRPSSILSGTSTLEELKELKDLLHQSSYVPKQTRTRRPTIEKIKSAIEKAKQTALIDRSESTINDSIEFSDASTITEKKKKKIKSTKKPLNSPKTGSITTRSINRDNDAQSNKKGKKIIKKKKAISTNNVEVQCSLFKIKINDQGSVKLETT